MDETKDANTKILLGTAQYSTTHPPELGAMQSSTYQQDGDYIVIPSPTSDKEPRSLISFSDLKFSLQSLGPDFTLEQAIDKVVELLKENQDLKGIVDHNTQMMQKQFELFVSTRQKWQNEQSEMKKKFDQTKQIIHDLKKDLQCKKKVIESLMDAEVESDESPVEQTEIVDGSPCDTREVELDEENIVDSSIPTSIPAIQEDLDEEVNKLRRMNQSLARSLECTEGTRQMQEEIIEKLENEKQQLKKMVSDLNIQLSMSVGVVRKPEADNGETSVQPNAKTVNASARSSTSDSHAASTSPPNDDDVLPPLGDHSKAAFESYVSSEATQLPIAKIQQEAEAFMKSTATSNDASSKASPTTYQNTQEANNADILNERDKDDSDMVIVQQIAAEKPDYNLHSQVLDEAAQVSCNFMEELTEEREKVKKLKQQLADKVQEIDSLQKKLQVTEQQLIELKDNDNTEIVEFPQSITQEAKSLMDELKCCNDKLIGTEKEKDAYYMRCTEYQEEIVQLRETMKRLNAEKEDLKMRHIESLRVMGRRLEQMEKDKNNLEDEHKLLKAQYDNFIGNYKALHETRQKVESEKLKLLQRLKQSEERINILTAQQAAAGVSLEKKEQERMKAVIQMREYAAKAENVAVWEVQAEVFKKDFEAERQSRENAVSEKEALLEELNKMSMLYKALQQERDREKMNMRLDMERMMRRHQSPPSAHQQHRAQHDYRAGGHEHLMMHFDQTEGGQRGAAAYARPPEDGGGYSSGRSIDELDNSIPSDSHEGEAKFMCPKCGTDLPDIDTLEIHTADCLDS